jgi:hypothetical protein
MGDKRLVWLSSRCTSRTYHCTKQIWYETHAIKCLAKLCIDISTFYARDQKVTKSPPRPQNQAFHFLACTESKTSYSDATYSVEVSFPTVTFRAKYSKLPLKLLP